MMHKSIMKAYIYIYILNYYFVAGYRMSCRLS
uniref:Uncharacterized protein n=1 Tax=Arundo donax TaxID=35708 RepID=A0A0A8Y258_ARUDO